MDEAILARYQALEEKIRSYNPALDTRRLSDAFTFALLIVVLCVKPTGLFGEKVTDKV